VQQEVRFADAGNDRHADHPKHHLKKKIQKYTIQKVLDVSKRSENDR